MFIALIPFSTSLFGSYPEEQLSLVIYAVNLILASVMRLMLWTYAIGKHRLVDKDISPQLLKFDRLTSIVMLLIFMLMIGVSFINVAAARPIFALLGVSGFTLSFIAKNIYQ